MIIFSKPDDMWIDKIFFPLLLIYINKETLLRAGEEGDRGLDGWMASSTLWTWFWVDSGSW